MLLHCWSFNSQTACCLVGRGKCRCCMLAGKKCPCPFCITVVFVIVDQFGIYSRYSTWGELIVVNFSLSRDRSWTISYLRNRSKEKKAKYSDRTEQSSCHFAAKETGKMHRFHYLKNGFLLSQFFPPFLVDCRWFLRGFSPVFGAMLPIASTPWNKASFLPSACCTGYKCIWEVSMSFPTNLYILLQLTQLLHSRCRLTIY